MNTIIEKDQMLSIIDKFIQEKEQLIKDIFLSEDTKWHNKYLLINAMDEVSFYDDNNWANYNFEMGGLMVLQDLKREI